MRKSARLGYWLIGIIVLGALAWLLFPGIWIEREEALGVRVGDDKQTAVKSLSQHGVQDVLPLLLQEVSVSRKNIDELWKLERVDSICVNDHATATSVQIIFGADGVANQVELGSVKGFAELSEGMTRREVIAKLKMMMVGNDALVSFSCIRNIKWIRIDGGNQFDLDYLFSFNVWSMDVPNSYSRVRIEFRDNRVSKIRFRWQPSETL
ncbi:hypothetical protein [Ralstonia solanacearum]|uniref:hypothetical protein n=1 Tax=Ralstonia solanacearum TaxID=305 RepID=UPI001595D12A|nr:hypothetical protein [Ralstonia solanacearum]